MSLSSYLELMIFVRKNEKGSVKLQYISKEGFSFNFVKENLRTVYVLLIILKVSVCVFFTSDRMKSFHILLFKGPSPLNYFCCSNNGFKLFLMMIVL